MARLTKSYVDELVRDIIRDKRANASGWVRCDCPFCQERGKSADTKKSFAYDTRKQGFVCNRCGIRGYLTGAVRLDPRPTRKAQPVRFSDFVSMSTSEARGSLGLQDAFSYMFGRGFTTQDLYRADIHVAISGQYQHRVILPHKEADGRWWGFSARLYVPGQVKVLYPPGMPRKLYNGHVLSKRTTEPALVVEGVLDAVRYLPDVVAALGKPTQEHAAEFLSSQRPLLFALDGDAWRDAQAWVRKFRLWGKGPPVKYVALPPGEDPDSIDPKWLLEESKKFENDVRNS